MPDTPTFDDNARAALGRVVRDGMPPDGISPDDCGPWAHVVRAVYDAHASGGAGAARDVFDAAVRTDKGRGVASLLATLANDAPPVPLAPVSSFRELPASARLPESAADGASPWLDAYESFARYVAPASYHRFHVPVALWVLSVTAARRVALAMGVKRFYPSLMIAITGTTTKYSKTGALGVGTGLLESAGLRHLQHVDNSTPQAMLRSMTAMTGTSYGELSEEGQEFARRRMAFAGQRGWVYDEAGQLLDAMARPNGPMSDFTGMLRRMDDNAPIYEYATIARGIETVRAPYMPLLLGLTPADLKPHARNGASAWRNGLYARMAFIAPPPGEPGINARFPSEAIPYPRNVISPLRDWYERLGVPDVEVTERLDKKDNPTGEYSVSIGELPVQLCTLASAAETAFYAYHWALAGDLQDAVNEDLHGSYGRFAEKAMRIAMLLASLENGGRIELRHWARAQAITEVWRETLHNLYDGLATTDTPSRERGDEDRIIAQLERRGPLTARDAGRYAHVSTAEAFSILDRLTRLGEVTATQVGKATRYEVSQVSPVASVAHPQNGVTLRSEPAPYEVPQHEVSQNIPSCDSCDTATVATPEPDAAPVAPDTVAPEVLAFAREVLAQADALRPARATVTPPTPVTEPTDEAVKAYAATLPYELTELRALAEAEGCVKRVPLVVWNGGMKGDTRLPFARAILKHRNVSLAEARA